MNGVEVGRTRFVDGMRVAREHLEHLQDVLLGHVAGGRETVGLGKVCHGLQVTVQQDGSVSVGPGLAIDAQGRALAIPEAQTPAVDFGGGATLHLVLLYSLRAEGVVTGVPTLPLAGEKDVIVGAARTVKVPALAAVPPGVVTEIGPVVAADGTVAVI